jgi:hypothetical protein
LEAAADGIRSFAELKRNLGESGVWLRIYLPPFFCKSVIRWDFEQDCMLHAKSGGGIIPTMVEFLIGIITLVLLINTIAIATF